MAWAVFPKKMKSDRKEDRATSQLALRIRKGVKKEGRRGKRKEKEGREGARKREERKKEKKEGRKEVR